MPRTRRSPSSAHHHAFAHVTEDELWLAGTRTELLRKGVDQGWALARDFKGTLSIQGSDTFPSGPFGTWEESSQQLRDALVRSAALDAMPILRTISTVSHEDQHVRIIKSGRYVSSPVRGHFSTSITITIARRDPLTGESISITTTPETLSPDCIQLISLMKPLPAGPVPDQVPILWRGGSASVLFHELIGHRSQSELPALKWPPWLTVSDQPFAEGLGRMIVDDTGVSPRAAMLTKGQPLQCRRRQTFRDMPLVRMTNLICETAGLPLRVPDQRMEVWLVEHGSYDSDSDRVSLNISVADHVDGSTRRRLPPFRIDAGAEQIAAVLVGGRGPLTRYPGIVCGDEGQRVPVGSWSMELLTAPLRSS